MRMFGNYVKAMADIIASSFPLGNKRGQVDGRIMALVGALIVIVLAVQLGPTMFDGADNITGAPSWVDVALPVIIGAGLVLFVWRAFSQ